MVDEERLTRLASGVLADIARLRRLAETNAKVDVIEQFVQQVLAWLDARPKPPPA